MGTCLHEAGALPDGSLVYSRTGEPEGNAQSQLRRRCPLQRWIQPGRSSPNQKGSAFPSPPQLWPEQRVGILASKSERLQIPPQSPPAGGSAAPDAATPVALRSSTKTPSLPATQTHATNPARSAVADDPNRSSLPRNSARRRHQSPGSSLARVVAAPMTETVTPLVPPPRPRPSS